jgi:uncharacterized RDD family membrane protein YckC
MNEQDGINQYATLTSAKRRIGSFIIDDFVVGLLLLGIFWEQLQGIKDIVALSQFTNENFFVFIAVKVIYHTLFVWQGGKTLGKYLTNMKVVTLENGTVPTFDKALLRALMRVVSETIFYLGFILAFFTPNVQTLHDKLSGCVVIDA